VRRFLQAVQLLLITATVALTGGCYLLRQGAYLFSERASAVPVGRAESSSETAAAEREFLRTAALAREFAADTIGLKTGKNYTTYVQTDKSYLAAVVSAAGRLSLDPYLWRFPLIGSVPYKGFFQTEGARREAAKLEKAGYDTWIRGVDAFSTLGFTRDPLYSFMADYPPHRTAELIIHEQVHATVWVKNNSSFNEELASFVGDTGAREFIIAIYGEDSPEFARMEMEERDRDRWLEDIARLRNELEELYRSGRSDEEKLELKKRVFSDFQTRFAGTYAERYETELYSRIPELAMNNAFVALYGVYYGNSALFAQYYRSLGSDLALMVESLRPLDGSKQDPYAYMRSIMDLTSSGEHPPPVPR
jgi:predicted aminopeptidase